MDTTEQPDPRPAFTHVTPIFCVANVAESLAHYRDVLGWEILWQWSDDQEFEGGTPTFACVVRGDVGLFLGQERQGVPGAWIHVNVASLADLDTLHAEYKASGATIAEPPTDRSWGLREMLVQDLDGNTIRIGAGLPTDDGDSKSG